jgi:hypothetical protein
MQCLATEKDCVVIGLETFLKGLSVPVADNTVHGALRIIGEFAPSVKYPLTIDTTKNSKN